MKLYEVNVCLSAGISGRMIPVTDYIVHAVSALEAKKVAVDVYREEYPPKNGDHIRLSTTRLCPPLDGPGLCYRVGDSDCKDYHHTFRG
jgi:hypothetical protein